MLLRPPSCSTVLALSLIRPISSMHVRCDRRVPIHEGVRMNSRNAPIATGACALLILACAQAHSQSPAMPVPVSAAAADDSRERTGARLDAKWVSAVIGMRVVTPAGAALGKVNDVIVDGYGRATFALVSYGGAFGVGRKYAAIPWAAVAEMLDRDRLVVERTNLENAPRLLRSKPDIGDAHWRYDAEGYWRGRLEVSR
jgi:sporulation protein YlmC with PRC-barrel domain